MREDFRIIVGMDIGLKSLIALSTGEKYGGDVFDLAREAWNNGGSDKGLLKMVVHSKLRSVPWHRFKKIIVENVPCDEEGWAFVVGGRGAKDAFRYPLGYVKEQVRRFAKEHDIVLVWRRPGAWSKTCPKCEEKLYDTSRTREYRCSSCGFRMDRDTFSALRTLLFYYGIEKWVLDDVTKGYFASDEEGEEFRLRTLETLAGRPLPPEDREILKRGNLAYLESHNRLREVGWL